MSQPDDGPRVAGRTMRAASSASKEFREVFLRKPKEASAWDFARNYLGWTMAQYSACFSIIIPGFAVGGVMAFLLPDAWLGLALLGGVGSAALGFWYYQIYEPALVDKGLQRQAFTLAMTPIQELKFINGKHGDFLPKGAIRTSSRDVVLGIDPENLLIRHVEIDASRRISIDRIYGLERYTAIELLRIPASTVGIAMGRLFGHKTLTQPALRFLRDDGSSVDIRIDPEQVGDARSLVRQINARRLEMDDVTS